MTSEYLWVKPRNKTKKVLYRMDYICTALFLADTYFSERMVHAGLFPF